MRTKRIKLYKYSELDANAKQKVINRVSQVKGLTLHHLTASEAATILLAEFLKDGTIYTEK